jgi:hypothetical protein
MQIIKFHEIKHSGQGENATHLKISKELRENGLKSLKSYCEKRGWDFFHDERMGTIKISSSAPFGFYCLASIGTNPNATIF